MKKSIVIFLLILIVFSGIILNLKVKKEDNLHRNNFYSEDIKKINENDFCLDKISLNMSIEEVKKILGEPLEVSEFVDTEENINSYKRFDYENLIIQFDYENEKVNYIASSKTEYKNARGISVGDRVTDVLTSYFSNKKIEVYENSYGKYEILYGKEDAIEYIENLNSENKTFGYIYKYNEEINSIIFSMNGKIIEFYFTNNLVNMIIIAERYTPW